MEAFKITLFEQEYTCLFPPYRSLSSIDSQALRVRIANKFGLVSSETAIEFAITLSSRQTFYYIINAEEKFSLLQVLTAIGINPLQEIFINWDRFEKIDSFQTADVARYFNDLWYPVADDIDLFDASTNWVVSIRHDGMISFIR